MKFKLLIALAFISVLTSCTSDNNSGSGEPTNYFPLETGNYWTYDVTGANLSERDSLYIANDTVINTKTYKKPKTLDLPFGFFSNSLNNNGLRKEGSSVVVTGSTGLNLGDTFPINLSLNDFVIFKEDASNNDQLSSISGVLSQDFQGYPLELTYAMKSTAMETLPTFTSPDGEVYTDVKKVKITLNLKITTTQTVIILGNPTQFTITIMNPQDVVVSTQYYSKNIGMVYTNTTISYELQDLSQYNVTLPIPQSGSQMQEEFLDTYQVD